MLEPTTTPQCLGLAQAVAHGQALHLEPAASLSSWLTLALFQPTGPVRNVERDGTVHCFQEGVV
jgi:hypothetical protein